MIVGLDISKKTMDACIVLPKGRAAKTFNNTPRGADDLFAWAQVQRKRLEGDDASATPRIIMEPTGTYHTLAAAILHALGARVCIVQPRRARDFAKAMGFLSKTDSADAHALAMYGERADLRDWTPPKDSIEELRALVARLLTVTDVIRRENLRLSEHARVVCWLGVGASIRRSLDWHAAELRELEKTIEGFFTFAPHAELRQDRDLVRTIPGVGPQAAAHLLCLLRSRPLDSAREAAALAGVIPVHRQSGTSINGKPRISHEGDNRVRAGLYMPTLSACTHNPDFRARYQALVASGKPKKAALIACMHRLIRVAYGVLTHGNPYESPVRESSITNA